MEAKREMFMAVRQCYNENQNMAKIIVKNQTIKTLSKNGVDYICITDITRQKNPIELETC